jgi:hypothetical protein
MLAVGLTLIQLWTTKSTLQIVATRDDSGQR